MAAHFERLNILGVDYTGTRAVISGAADIVAGVNLRVPSAPRYRVAADHDRVAPLRLVHIPEAVIDRHVHPGGQIVLLLGHVVVCRSDVAIGRIRHSHDRSPGRTDTRAGRILVRSGDVIRVRSTQS